MFHAETNGHPYPLLVLHGTIEGVDLIQFSDLLERAIGDSPDGLGLDLADLQDWSLLAQAVVLATARRLQHDGGELVLYNPSMRLRLASRRLGVFGRVPTHDGPNETRDIRFGR